MLCGRCYELISLFYILIVITQIQNTSRFANGLNNWFFVHAQQNIFQLKLQVFNEVFSFIECLCTSVFVFSFECNIQLKFLIHKRKTQTQFLCKITFPLPFILETRIALNCVFVQGETFLTSLV